MLLHRLHPSSLLHSLSPPPLPFRADGLTPSSPHYLIIPSQFKGRLWLSAGRSQVHPIYNLKYSVKENDVWYSDDGARWVNLVNMTGDFYLQNKDVIQVPPLIQQTPHPPSLSHALSHALCHGLSHALSCTADDRCHSRGHTRLGTSASDTAWIPSLTRWARSS